MIDVPEDIKVELFDAKDRSLPLIVTPKSSSLDILAWVKVHVFWINQALYKYGAILFRKLSLNNPSNFESFTKAISSDFPTFEEESSPRHVVSGVVSTSTDYPPHLPIQFHNEYSYTNKWPMKLFFFCSIPPDKDGETLIANSRKVLEHISPDNRERFKRLKVLYKRNYVSQMGVSWEKAFQTSNKLEVEERCRHANIGFKWTPDGLSTEQIGDAIVLHPKTGEQTWFNHSFFFNIRALEPIELREYLLTQPQDQLSTNTYYGDGTPIEEDVITQIRDAYQKEAVRFDWRQGDILLFDNMLTSHARASYSGNRKIYVVMSEAFHRKDLSDTKLQ